MADDDKSDSEQQGQQQQQQEDTGDSKFPSQSTDTHPDSVTKSEKKSGERRS